MADIFVSYARADTSVASLLARALEAEGWVVWWDRRIPAGKAYDDVIDEALAAALCVIVIWSSASVKSRYVRGEAEDAATRGVLIPILIEHDVIIPRTFRALQAADLVGGTAQARIRHLNS